LALVAVDRRGVAVDPAAPLAALAARAAARPSLPGLPASGVFGEEARVYIDQGGHPEFATYECVDPDAYVARIVRSERMLGGCAEEVAAEDSAPREIALLRSNIDYGPDAPTWGRHESYLYRGDAGEAPRWMLGFLASRPILSGAGGFDNRSRDLEFMLSPRVAHMTRVFDPPTGAPRGMWRDRTEPLSGVPEHRRIHMAVGENLCSQLSNWLLGATTALVLHALERGHRPSPRCELRHPLEAMQVFARDVRCRRTASNLQGARMTAAQVQREYLEFVQSRLGAESPWPSWAGECCARWREALERIEAGAPDSVDDRLDWAIKFRLFERDAASRRGGRRPDRARAIDLRFGQLGGRGIFEALDAAGALRHRIDAVDKLLDPSVDPPAAPRAEIRRRLVRELHERGARGACSWSDVWDFTRGRRVALSDPGSPQWEWRPLEADGRNSIGALIE
jgi:proteasome accessory factor A